MDYKTFREFIDSPDENFLTNIVNSDLMPLGSLYTQLLMDLYNAAIDTNVDKYDVLACVNCTEEEKQRVYAYQRETSLNKIRSSIIVVYLLENGHINSIKGLSSVTEQDYENFTIRIKNDLLRIDQGLADIFRK